MALLEFVWLWLLVITNQTDRSFWLVKIPLSHNLFDKQASIHERWLFFVHAEYLPDSSRCLNSRSTSWQQKNLLFYPASNHSQDNYHLLNARYTLEKAPSPSPDGIWSEPRYRIRMRMLLMRINGHRKTYRRSDLTKWGIDKRQPVGNEFARTKKGVPIMGWYYFRIYSLGDRRNERIGVRILINLHKLQSVCVWER